MDGMQSVYMTMKEVMGFLRRGRAQIDRYRQRPDFPKPIGLSETGRGALLFLRHEIVEWAKNRLCRTLRPPADDSV
jgi:predicted DNA-binding transcriptional regulator AlpA